MCRPDISQVSPTNSLFKNIFSVNYHIHVMSCLSCDLNNEHADQSRVLPSLTDKWPFQDHLPGIALHTQKSSILGNINSNHAAIMTVMKTQAECMGCDFVIGPNQSKKVGASQIRCGIKLSYHLQYPKGKIQISETTIWFKAHEDTFQWKQDATYYNLEEVTRTADDTSYYIYGTKPDGSDHDLNFTRFLEVRRCSNLKLNANNIQFECSRLIFWYSI